MDNRTNTIAGWVLAGCASALGLSIVSGMVFHDERPETMGYPIEGVEQAAGGEKEVPLATLLASADPDNGAKIFNKCSACHTIDQGAPNGIGPNLYAIVGDPVAHGRGGFAFSDALKSVGGEWTFEKLNAWLTSPRKFASGTKMTFAGLSDPQDRADIIVYLNNHGSNVPLPAAPTEPANAEEEALENQAGATSTANLVNEATPAPGAPSVDERAAEEAEQND
ncbi:c-type cytochrome [Stakelama saccharophila]|uniref:Cytochrome c family protein n=1 Tax=Stakelama saccharophila TaxID=3075605 RepID=A0ABZ0B9H3_9SPHN|nr:cytochrome c family protein [Stakelama sp. W311]WNO53944.1 cytochrome c family protein [Stakelama sp. W311]